MMKSKFTVVVCALAIALAAVIGIFITLIATGVVDSTPKKLVISSGTAEKVYDGKEITSADWKLDSGTLREGHRLKVTTMGNQTDVGSCDNEFTAVVLDENGADVSEDYELVLKPGKLVVRARMLVIKSASASKIYDGTPLFSEDFTVVDGTVADGQRLKVVCDGTQTDVGECVNSCVATVFDEDNREVTFNYTFSIECGTISVTQKEITLQSGSDSKIYDGLPLTYENVNITAGSLVDGHTVNFEYTGTQTDVGSTENRYVATISDEYGRNVTANYAITYGFGKLEVAKRTITLQGASGVKQYNGEPLVANDLPTVVQGELVGGQEIFAEYPMSRSDAGTINNDFVVAIRTADGKDVTANYEIITYFGSLTVSPAPLTVLSNDNNKPYDGTPLTDDGYRVVGELANPLHSVTVNVHGSQTEVGVGKNEMSVTVYNEFGSDVTSNYELALVEGELLVTARPVTVQTADGLKTYDGTYLTNEKIVSQENLLDGHRLDVTFDGKQLGVGKSKNTISAWHVYDWYGNDVSSNYNVNVICGELVVNECSFAIGSGSASKVYDGNPLTCYNLPTVTGESVAWNTANNGEFYGTIGSTGHTLWLSVTASVTDYTKTSVENKFTYKITDQSGTDVTANYKIATHFGALSVTKREVTFTSLGGYCEYNGTALTNENEPTLGGTLANGEHATFDVYGSQTDVGTSDNNFSVTIWRDNVDVTDNYSIKYYFGSLIVTERELWITTESAQKAYDGTPLTKNEWHFDNSIQSVVGGHELSVTIGASITDCGTVDNDRVKWFVIANGEYVTRNYKIHVTPGKLTITQNGTYTITTGSASRQYDGTALAEQNWDVTNKQAIEKLPDHVLTVRVTASITEPGTIKNTAVYTVTANGKDVTNNFAFVEEFGKLTVERRKIVLKSADDKKTYDGQPLTNANVDLQFGELVQGNVLSATANGRITNVGTIDNTFTYKITDKGDNDVTQYYDVSSTNGKLSVTKLKVVVVTDEAHDEYNGMPLTADGWRIAEGYGIVYGHTLKVKTNGSQTNAGTSDNTAESVFVFDGNNYDVSDNYDISVSCGKLTVTPKNITLKGATQTHIYDGTEFTDDEYEIAEQGFLSALGHTVTVVAGGRIVYVGEVENKLGATVTDMSGLDVTANYKFNILNGKLKVIQAPLNVTTETATKVYDGTSLTDDVYTIDGLVNGEYEEVAFGGEQTSVGTSKNTCSVRVFDSAYNETTSNYEIIVHEGDLVVTKATLTVTTIGATKQYDGEALTNEDYTIDGLVDGEYEQVSFSGQRLFVGTSNNTCNVSVEDVYGNVTTGNYNITVHCGELIVTTTPLHVTTDGATKVYDGEALTYDSGSVNDADLAWGETAYVECVGSLAVVGETNNSCSVRVENQDGVDTTKCYEIICTYGKLTVTKRPITFVSSDLTKVYDGTPLYSDESSVSYGNDDLVLGHSVVVTTNGSITVAGETDNTFTVVIYDGIENVTNYYEIKYDCGKLSVTKRPLHLTTESASKVYDGEVLTASGYTVDGLADGEYCTVDCTGKQLDVGSTQNRYRLTAYNANGEFSNNNYYITYSSGTLTVTQREVTLRSESATKYYDGTPLTENGVTLVSGTLVGGQTWTYECYGTQTEVGVVQNGFRATITDENGADVTGNYKITYEVGRLSVLPREITVRSADASKDYDGTPLTNHEWQLVSVVGVVDGHTVEVSVSGTITEVGEAKNTIAQVIVRDGNGKDVSYNYDVKRQEGTLTVKGTGGGSGGGTGGSAGAGVQMDGSIGGGGGNPKGIPLVDVTSSVTDSIYLKLGSFGDYNGKGWDRATAYDKLLDGKFGFDYLTGISLSNNGETEAKITIDNHMNTYVLATYLSMLDGDYAVQTSDEEYIGDNTSPYAAYYFYQRYTTEYYTSFVSNLGKYTDDELAYRNYVYANYMQVPDSTRTYLDEVIAHNGWKKGDANLLERVANYIQWSAKYNLEYDTTLDEEDDLVLAFLTKYKEGVCRHYASAATLMFRALGYPARYTVGLTGKTVANKKVTITDKGAHAWTEVYLDGIGWVQLEVTGFSSDGGSGGSDDDKPSRTQKLELTPVTARKQYDGTALTPEQTIIDYNPKMYAGYAYIEDLLAKGYTYTATVMGSRTEIGYGISKITSFTLYDADGNDVTEDYEIRCRPGKLQVYISQLVFETGSATKTYDGTPIVATDCNLTFGTLANGHRIAYALAKGSQTKVGTSGNTLVVSIVDADGNDVSEYYYIVGKYGKLTVNSREVTFTAGSATKSYNGTALTCDSYKITAGSLAEGHTAVVTLSGSQTNKGRSDNVITSIVIYDADGNDVTANYITKRVTGTLQVTK